MKKGIMSVLAILATVLFIAVPAQASAQFDDNLVGVSQSQSLPAFMQDLDATLMTDAEMSEVKGEFLPIAYYAIIYGIPLSYSLAYSSATGVPLRVVWDAWNSQ